MFRTILRITCLSLLFVIPANVQGQAYCSLRDPARKVYEMFPEATSYRSIVETVDEEARQTVSEDLPFTLHFNELGRHTLYVAVKGHLPLGIVHVRSEAGRWGLVEIAWAFDTDLRVVDFGFQRCRDPKRSSIESESFRELIKGKSFDELRPMLTPNGAAINTTEVKVQPDVEPLALVVLRSALKTVAVTKAVWKKDVETIQVMANTIPLFPDTVSVQVAHGPFPQAILVDIRTQLGSDDSGIDRSRLLAARLLSKESALVGFAVRTHWRSTQYTHPIWWFIDSNGVLAGTKPDSGSFDEKTVEALHGLVGKSAEDMSGCATALELAALEVLVLTNHLNP